MTSTSPVDRPVALGRWLQGVAAAIAVAATAGLVLGGSVATVVVPLLALAVVTRPAWLAVRWWRERDRGDAARAAVLAAFCVGLWVAAAWIIVRIR